MSLRKWRKISYSSRYLYFPFKELLIETLKMDKFLLSCMEFRPLNGHLMFMPGSLISLPCASSCELSNGSRNHFTKLSQTTANPAVDQTFIQVGSWIGTMPMCSRQSQRDFLSFVYILFIDLGSGLTWTVFAWVWAHKVSNTAEWVSLEFPHRKCSSLSVWRHLIIQDWKDWAVRVQVA